MTHPLRRIYLDANVVIDLVEQIAPHAAIIAARLAVPGVVGVISQLTRLECRVMPLRRNDPMLRKNYDRFFARCRRVRITRAVFEKATEIRARYPSFKTLDALHLAAAVVGGCNVFLTNDQQLTRFAEIAVETI
jgi:predicted nucleic acid-binding protein